MDGGSIPPISTIGRVARCGAPPRPLLPRPIPALILVVAMGLGVLAVLGLCAMGLAIAALHPRLAPVAESSVLGQRWIGFVRFALACGALFAASFVGVAMSSDLGGARTPAEFGRVTGQLEQLLLSVIGGGAMIFWIWLTIDLLRIGRRRRRNTIDLITHRLAARAPGPAALARRWGRRALSDASTLAIVFLLALLAGTGIVGELASRLG